MNTILLRIPNRIPEVIHSSTNFYETLDYMENLARDNLMLLNGSREFSKIENIKKSGFYAVPEFRKITIYRKRSNGWLFSGELVIVKEFELIISKYQREIKREEENIICADIHDKMLSIFLEINNRCED